MGGPGRSQKSMVDMRQGLYYGLVSVVASKWGSDMSVYMLVATSFNRGSHVFGALTPPFLQVCTVRAFSSRLRRNGGSAGAPHGPGARSFQYVDHVADPMKVHTSQLPSEIHSPKHMWNLKWVVYWLLSFLCGLLFRFLVRLWRVALLCI